jgi:hypothetical protein
MRDFRWYVMANAEGKCVFPLIPTSKSVQEMHRITYKLGNGEITCSQPIVWDTMELSKSGEDPFNGDVIYTA